mgnify:FL=1
MENTIKDILKNQEGKYFKYTHKSGNDGDSRIGRLVHIKDNYVLFSLPKKKIVWSVIYDDIVDIEPFSKMANM